MMVMVTGENPKLFERLEDHLHVFALDTSPGTQLMELLYNAKVSAQNWAGHVQCRLTENLFLDE